MLEKLGEGWEENGPGSFVTAISKQDVTYGTRVWIPGVRKKEGAFGLVQWHEQNLGS